MHIENGTFFGTIRLTMLASRFITDALTEAQEPADKIAAALVVEAASQFAQRLHCTETTVWSIVQTYA